MKRLSLVLGSLLVVSASLAAKEVVPAPVVVEEAPVQVITKEVIVYRDKAPEWKPTGTIKVHAKGNGQYSTKKKLDGFKVVDEKGDARKHYATGRLEFKANVKLTPNQSLEFRSRVNKGLTHHNDAYKVEKDTRETYLQHTYDFGKVADTKIGANLESKYTYDKQNTLRERAKFDFADYLFSCDYFKTTSAVLAPTFAYGWDGGNHDRTYALYADYQADIYGGVTLEAEFDNLFANTKSSEVENGKRISTTGKTGSVEITLNRPTTLYAEGPHKVVFEPKLVYATNWAYNKKTVENGLGGTIKSNGNKDKWGSYTAKFEPVFTYSYEATKFVTLDAKLGGEYVNRIDRRTAAQDWKLQPYVEVGFNVAF